MSLSFLDAYGLLPRSLGIPTNLCAPPLVVLAAGMPVDEAGSAKANGGEPKTGLGRVFNFKLGCLDDVHVVIYADARQHLQLKTRPRFVHG